MVSWTDFRERIHPRSAKKARLALSARFSGLIADRTELARAVGSGLRDEPLHRIVSYKEAFSPQLVRSVLDHLGVTEGTLLDPFVGVGTSLLVAAERGMPAVGVDLLPFAAFASATLIRSPLADWPTLDKHRRRVLETPLVDRGSFPDFPVREWAFSPAALAELTGLHRSALSLPAGLERDMVRLALLAVVEESSQATKDGTSLRRRPHGTGRPGRFKTRKTRRQVRDAFVDRLVTLEADARRHAPPHNGSHSVVGDARELPTLVSEPGGFAVSVFSPPYPNRYDYTANYQLELGFGFIDSRDQLKDLRRAQLRSHLEAPWPERRTVESAALDEFLAALLAAKRPGDQTGRVFKMVAGFFEDMKRVLEGLLLVMRPGAPVAIVVGTQVFNGEELPTDLLLVEIAADVGLAVKEVWFTRNKGVAVQQRARYAEVPASRESILVLET